MSPLVSLTPAAFGLIGTGISSALNFASQMRTNAQNKQMAQQAFEREREAIKRQNEYNAPSQQVARMMAAGLSPNLAYGASGELTGQQSDIPSYNPIASEAPQVADFGQQYVRSAQLGLDTREQMNRDQLAQAELALKDAQSYLAVMSGNYNSALAERVAALLGYDIMQAELNLDTSEANLKKIDSEIREIEQNIQESCSRVGLNEAQVKELSARAGLSEAETIRILTLLPSEVRNMDAQTALAWASSAQAQESVRYMAGQLSDMRFYQDLSDRKFNFEKFEWKNEQDKWIAQFKQDRANSLANNVTRILTVGLGAAAMKSGQALPPFQSQQRYPSPIITPAGGRMFDQNWNQ